jgi:hypothetical protein
VSQHPKPPKKFPVRKRKSQTKARRKAARRRRNEQRKREAVWLATLYKTLGEAGFVTPEQVEAEMERLRLREELERRQEK